MKTKLFWRFFSAFMLVTLATVLMFSAIMSLVLQFERQGNYENEVRMQAREVAELNALWYDTENTWDAVHAQAKELDELINEFNEATGILKAL